MDAEAFLRAFHRAHPGITTRAFARGRTDDGRSSYEVLADAAGEAMARGQVILDLGCGDGHLLELLALRGAPVDRLVGVDLSADEVDIARARPSLRGAVLRCERAQEMSLPGASVGCVLSHLAFTLMSDIEMVVAEVARVLQPGGCFAAIVGGGPRGDDAFARFLDLLRETYLRVPARAPRLGDIRARREDGLRALFGGHGGFEAGIEIRDLALHLDGTGDEVWDHLAAIYELFVVPPDDLRALRARFAGEAARLAGPDGVVPCTAAMRLVTCRRALGAGAP
jgi:SAM-dependent methyltransferase